MSLLFPPEAIGLPAKFAGWRSGQGEAILHATQQPERFRVQICPTGCLSGDTIIVRNRGGCSKRQTIRQMYKCHHKLNKGPKWKDTIPTMVRSYDGTRVQLHEATDILYSGAKPVYELCLADRTTLKATYEHLVMTDTGWIPLGELTNKHLVMVDTIKPVRSGGVRDKLRDSYITNLWNHPYASRTITSKEVRGWTRRIEVHRAVYEAYINGISIEEYCQILRANSNEWENLRYIDPARYCVHHKDGDHYNNDPTNLIHLSIGDHNAEHDLYRNFGQGVPHYSRVVDVRYVGEEETYDIECPDYHNFVANGIVVHNSGKSLQYTASSILLGGRAIILTSTKGLQTQLLEDFKSIGMVDVRGRNSYFCNLEADGETTCDHGPCIAGIECKLKNFGCDYYNAVRRAQRAPLVVTNYSYWMNQNMYGDGLGNVDTLVCDEAHNAPDIVSNFLTISLDKEDEVLMPYYPSRPTQMTIPEWREWARSRLPSVEREVESVQRSIRMGTNNRSIRRRLAQLKRTVVNLEEMRSMGENWICDVTRYRIELCPVWPAPYCEGVLFRDIPNIIMTSASMCGKTAAILGVARDEYSKLEFEHSFPIERRRLVHVPTVRMNYKISDMELRQWVTRIDQILRARQDRKGIIHTVSYKRQEMVMMNSKNMKCMMDHGPKEVEKAVKLFKQAKAPAYLVSPSVTTGYDFPGDECRIQIIGKIAYPDSTSKLVKARTKSDKGYNSYIAMQQLIQTCGRSVRSKDDFCENIIIDDNITWFINRYKSYAPEWFTDSFVSRNTVPPAPKLETM